MNPSRRLDAIKRLADARPRVPRCTSCGSPDPARPFGSGPTYFGNEKPVRCPDCRAYFHRDGRPLGTQEKVIIVTRRSAFSVSDLST